MTDLRLHRHKPQCQLLERIVNREKGDLNSCLFVVIPGYSLSFVSAHYRSEPGCWQKIMIRGFLQDSV